MDTSNLRIQIPFIIVFGALPLIAVHSGGWSAIVPVLFFYVFGGGAAAAVYTTSRP